MDKKLLFKILAISLMALLLLIPLLMVEGQIRDRAHRQREVQDNIANSSAGEQMLAGPVLAIHYLETVEIPAESEKTGPRRQVVERTLLLPPTELNLDGEAGVETRQRGIYQARLFRLTANGSGYFAVRPLAELLGGKTVSNVRASLQLGISDPRGISNDPRITVNGKAYRFASAVSTGESGLRRLSADLGPVDLQQASRFDFSFPLQLTGTTRLAFAPVGEANRIHLKSDWPHPNFGGRFLPQTRSVSGKGFDAEWSVSHLARNFDASLKANSGEALSINFIDPVNVYLQAERAVKYGVLFIALTFAGFFLTEILRRKPIHPMQYLLVGLALAIFFLLLIAFSEHLPFVAAYGIAATACIGLIAWYLAGALGGWRQGFAFGSGLTGLYGVLYGVLLSEDNALLMGSLLLFLALGTVMLATRRLNWYGLGNRLTESAE
jgi:inner membrane protein